MDDSCFVRKTLRKCISMHQCTLSNKLDSPLKRSLARIVHPLKQSAYHTSPYLQRHHNDSRAIKVVWPNIGKCRILRHLVVYGTNVFQRLVEECGIATHYSNCRRDTTPRADIIAWLRTITLEGDPHIGESSSHHLVREQLKAIRGFCHFHRASYKGY